MPATQEAKSSQKGRSAHPGEDAVQPSQQKAEESSADSVVLSVRMTRKDLELLDLVANLYGKTKTELAREAIVKEVHDLSNREALEDQVKRYREELLKQYDRISSRLSKLQDV